MTMSLTDEEIQERLVKVSRSHLVATAKLRERAEQIERLEEIRAQHVKLLKQIRALQAVAEAAEHIVGHEDDADGLDCQTPEEVGDDMWARCGGCWKCVLHKTRDALAHARSIGALKETTT